MRNKLQKFIGFSNSLLPHETEYLLSIQEFEDKQRLEIIEKIDYNCHQIHQFSPFEPQIDKRKYNHIQNWIIHHLEAIDVDQHFEWMLSMEQKIMTDNILMEDEKDLQKNIRNYAFPGFFFIKFYELVEQYSNFLLIRIRYHDFKLADHFLKNHRTAYLHSKSVYEKMNEVTRDILDHYSGQSVESKKWNTWLTEVFYEEGLDGLNRYLAMIRLVFISFNYREYHTIKDHFDYLDTRFSKGIYYSKRLLLNYYSNRLLLHSHFREYDKAVYYGYLSIRSKNQDYLQYVNNLCAVLLRLKRNEEALEILKKSAADAKLTKNIHSRIGFVAFYLEAMNKNRQFRQAENYGTSFLQAFPKEILQYRWHLFFSVYFEALLYRGQYQKLLNTARRYTLADKDKAYKTKPHYLPTIPLYIHAAEYKEHFMTRKEILSIINSYSNEYKKDTDLFSGFQSMLQVLKEIIPEILNYIVPQPAIEEEST